ncbi:MAG: hypothetical protein ACOX40_00775 [Bacilli bacterium]
MRFVEVTLTASSNKSISYPNGSFLVKDSNYHLIKQCEVDGYLNYAINYNNNNSLTVFLPTTGHYFIEINFNMNDVTKLELSVNVVDTVNIIDIFSYSPSEQFSINLISNSKKQDKISQFELKQSGNFTISTTNTSQISNGYRFVILKRDTSDSASSFIVLTNLVISADYDCTMNLTEGIYYIGYFALNESNSVSISMVRNLTSYGSEHLVPDPDVLTPCGSQINVEEAKTNIYNRSYRQSNITEGFTRLIYLSSASPSPSRLDYYWYSSDEDTAKITDYGTVLALPIDVSQKTVKVMAVYKNDMSKCYIKEFTVVKDTETYYSDPIVINLNMEVIPLHFSFIDLSDVDAPINMLQYYTWSSTNNVSVDYWGRIYANNNALGSTVSIVGIYNHNPKVRINVSVHIIATPVDVRLVAYDDGSVARNTYFNPTANIISNVRTDDIEMNYYASCSDETLIELLGSCELFFIHTHGWQNGIYTGSGWLESSELTLIDLSNLEMALLMTCNTGDGGYSQTRVNLNIPLNIVERMICCGAETVIGFSDLTYVRDCNIFAVDFAEQTMNNHLSIQNAIDSIDYSGYLENMSSIAVIGGNADNQIWG